MIDETLIKSIQTTFSFYGLVLSRKLSTYVAKQLQSVNENEREIWLTRIAEQVLSQNLESPNIDIKHIQLAIIECVRPENSLQDTETILNVIDTRKVPKIKYDLIKKKFVLEEVTTDMYPEAVHKSLVFKDRLTLLWYRTLEHELFAPLKFGETDATRLKLVQIEYLLSACKMEDVYVMGLLSQLTEGQYYLEDTSGTVKIDLKKANYQTGLITEGCIVIVHGNYDNEILQIKHIGFPPSESSSNARARFGHANTFGGLHPVSLKLSEKLKAREEANSDRMIIFVSELWVDNLIVLDKFKTMLDGYSDCPPIAFVLCGHFLSFPPNVTSAEKMKEGFKRLADIVMQFTDIMQNSKFIFIPGPYDLGAPKILPRNSLPKYVVEDFTKSIPGALLATNPCRIQYCTKEIVVLREDMLTKLCRNTLRFVNDGEVYEHYAKSIICQSHLTPMNLPVIPVYWKHDHAMQIYPSPDLIVVADQFESYTTSYADCQVINPGTFPKNNFSFKAYIPALNLIEDCAIPNESDTTI